MSFLSRMASLFPPPRFVDDPECRSAQEWAENYVAEPIPSAALVYDFALRLYEEAVADYDAIDAKAGQILQSAGLIAAALVALVGALKTPLNLAGFVALAFLGAGIATALWARQPLPRGCPPSVQAVLTHGSKLEPAEMQTWLSASLHAATAAVRSGVRRKSRWVRRATVLLAIGLAALLVAVATLAPIVT